MTNEKPISLREYFEMILQQRDQYFEEKIKNIETQIGHMDDKHTIAEVNIKELANTVYAASEKAILKAEDQQRELNVKNNEFRAQLKDQAEVLMPRNESQALHKGSDDKINALKRDLDSQIDLLRKDFDQKVELNRKGVQELRESRSTVEGKTVGARDFRDFAGWGVAILVGLLALAEHLAK